ncbi:MAG: DUF1657 domain-containing protein [Clostridiales bacterium]|nr:DUF1657 domain-containing protein [Clostridiales bacterium]MCF8023325.1 DUF1657 domain-containing protein [Clostridiales bacterium]
MTVGSNMHQTLSSLEGAAANLQSFALETQDQEAKKMYNNMHQQLQNLNKDLRNRVNYVEGQEPQYTIEQ